MVEIGENGILRKQTSNRFHGIKKSSNLDLISRRNQDSKWREISDDENEQFQVKFYEIES